MAECSLFTLFIIVFASISIHFCVTFRYIRFRISFLQKDDSIEIRTDLSEKKKVGTISDQQNIDFIRNGWQTEKSQQEIVVRYCIAKSTPIYTATPQPVTVICFFFLLYRSSIPIGSKFFSHKIFGIEVLRWTESNNRWRFFASIKYFGYHIRHAILCHSHTLRQTK